MLSLSLWQAPTWTQRESSISRDDCHVKNIFLENAWPFMTMRVVWIHPNVECNATLSRPSSVSNAAFLRVCDVHRLRRIFLWGVLEKQSFFNSLLIDTFDSIAFLSNDVIYYTCYIRIILHIHIWYTFVYLRLFDSRLFKNIYAQPDTDRWLCYFV